MSRVGRSGIGCAGAMLVLLASTPGARADERRACVEAHEQAQVNRQQGRLRAARADLTSCADAACPALVVKDCAVWLDQVNAEMPTVVVSARGPDGQDIADVQVLVDGAQVAGSLDGRPFAVDPGDRAFQFVRSDGQVREQRVLVVAGEKDRVLRVEFAARSASSASSTSSPSAPSPTPPVSSPEIPPARAGGAHIPTAAWVTGGITVAALGWFATFGVMALSKHSHYQSQCGHSCTTSDQNDVLTLDRIADAGLAVAIVAAGLTTYFILSAPHDDPRSAVWVGAFPLTGGAAATLGTRF